MMEESTTIHWHGHHQRGTPYMDGVPYVTQCPIPPKSSFRYHYMADTPGTHFWHSHSGMYTAVTFYTKPVKTYLLFIKHLTMMTLPGAFSQQIK